MAGITDTSLSSNTCRFPSSNEITEKLVEKTKDQTNPKITNIELTDTITKISNALGHKEIDVSSIPHVVTRSLYTNYAHASDEMMKGLANIRRILIESLEKVVEDQEEGVEDLLNVVEGREEVVEGLLEVSKSQKSDKS